MFGWIGKIKHLRSIWIATICIPLVFVNVVQSGHSLYHVKPSCWVICLYLFWHCNFEEIIIWGWTGEGERYIWERVWSVMRENLIFHASFFCIENIFEFIVKTRQVIITLVLPGFWLRLRSFFSFSSISNISLSIKVINVLQRRCSSLTKNKIKQKL